MNGRNKFMKAMLLRQVGQPLTLADLPVPTPSKNEVLIKVHTCGVCRTDLHIYEGKLKAPQLPLVLGHQIVGTIVDTGSNAKKYKKETRVGVPWLAKTCGSCHFCTTGKENLCDQARYTGFHVNGGFAEYCTADEQFIFPLSDHFSDTQAAPLLCGGMIGYRALRFTENALAVGFYGFGSSAHLLIQVACFQKRNVYVFTRKGDIEAQELAKTLGAAWCGSSEELPPKKLDASIIFASDGSLVPKALQALEKTGIVVCAGIHMSDIPAFPYHILWEERVIRSVANLTRKDGEEFLAIAAQIPIKAVTSSYPLEETNEALSDLKEGRLKGSAITVC
jgi:propanol-preferring alcohol dehydrogenase